MRIALARGPIAPGDVLCFTPELPGATHASAAWCNMSGGDLRASGQAGFRPSPCTSRYGRNLLPLWMMAAALSDSGAHGQNSVALDDE